MNTAPLQPFRPPWWLRGAHAQTMWGSRLRRLPPVDFEPQLLPTPDGDLLSLQWLHGRAGNPGVLLLHGLEGSARSHYIRGTALRLARRGWSAASLEWRGCGGSPGKGWRLYHSGETGDAALAADAMRERLGGAPLFAIGFSLGANVLGKWLGETGADNPLAAAVMIGTPFDLAASVRRLDTSLGGFYARRFMRSLVPKALARAATHPDRFDAGRIRAARTVLDYDHAVTAPLFGFEDAWDYYARSSCTQFLGGVRVPTLLLSAADDPLIPAESWPEEAIAGNPHMGGMLSARGGHIGFVEGRWPWATDSWAERHAVDFLRTQG